jgi:Restriction endonuclease
MWWSFALPEVIWVGGDGTKHGERTRKTIGGWSNTDVNGKPLKINSLSTRLTKVAGYRRTICKIEAQDYLLRRINGIEEPIVAKCLKAREVMLNLTIEAIQSLHWKDFETLVDIIFSRSGWNRGSALGGTQKLIDIELEQPITEERAAIQVKSDASQKTLEDYIASTDAAGQFSRFFFVCHSPTGKLAAPEGRDNVHVWTGEKLAEAVLRTGLHDWVLEKIVQS